jgi:hypothetical protein
MVNSAESKAKLAFEGNRRIVKSFNLVPYGPTDFEARLIPIKSDLQDADGALKISIASNAEPSTEYTMQECVSDSDDGLRVEVSDLLVEREPVCVAYRSPVCNGNGNLISAAPRGGSR